MELMRAVAAGFDCSNPENFIILEESSSSQMSNDIDGYMENAAKMVDFIGANK